MPDTKLLLGDQVGDMVMIAHPHLHVARFGNRLWVQVVLQRPFAGDDRTAAGTLIDAISSCLATRGFRWQLAIVQMEFGQTEGRQSICP
jgi:hypothetical protein